MNFVLLFIGGASFGIYAYAIQKNFSREAGIDIRMRVIQLLGAVFAGVDLWYLARTDSMLGKETGIGAVLLVTGLVSFLAARSALNGYRLTLAFSPDSPETLIDRGIYARVRHPFYMSYSLTWIGTAVSAPSVWTIFIAIIMVAIYASAARIEEHKFSRSSLADAYASYRRRTGMLWPSI